jgi:prephenate dehydrogenase
METSVALLGYGRFGSALGSLFQSAGIEVRAFDPWAEVPEAIRTESPAALCQGAELIALSIPVRAIGSALRALRPHLGPSQIVFDVASVKVKPQALMAEILGAAVPWVATHPMFGPTSLSQGEWPRHVVVCPNPSHAAAVERVRALYQALDCNVVEQDALAHDRTMATTHALAFFVAKGLHDIGVAENLHEAPPSFRSLARTVEAVRSDAGHLFTAIHCENPFAAAARRRLLESLVEVDQRLTQEGASLEADVTRRLDLAMPGLVERIPELRELRQRLDEVDGDLISLLARRARLSGSIGRAKAAVGVKVQDPDREAEVLSVRRRWARQAGLDEVAIEEIFQAILRFSRRVQGEPDENAASRRKSPP